MWSWIWQSKWRFLDFHQNRADSAKVSNTPAGLSHWAIEGRGTECLPIPKLNVTRKIECVPGFPKSIMVLLEVLWACEHAKGESFFQRTTSASSSVPCVFKITTTLLCMATRRGAMLAFGPWKTSICLWRRGLCLPKLWHLCSIFLRRLDKLPSLNYPFGTSKWYQGFCCGGLKWEE